MGIYPAFPAFRKEKQARKRQRPIPTQPLPSPLPFQFQTHKAKQINKKDKTLPPKGEANRQASKTKATIVRTLEDEAAQLVADLAHLKKGGERGKVGLRRVEDGWRS